MEIVENALDVVADTAPEQHWLLRHEGDISVASKNKNKTDKGTHVGGLHILHA